MPTQNKSFSEQLIDGGFTAALENAIKKSDSGDEKLKQSPASKMIEAMDALKTQPAGRHNSDEKVYIGTKVIRAIPMSETDFLISVKGKSAEEMQKQETQGDGYKVTYEDGYISWSPKRVFEQCYREVSQKEKNMMF